MLAALLPGLRDLRNPLAVGYTIYIALWLALGDRIPSKASATGIADNLYGLADQFGRGAPLAALSFISYLAGSTILVSRTPRWVLGLGWIGRRRSELVSVADVTLGPRRVTVGQLRGRTGEPELHALLPEAMTEELAHMDEDSRALEVATYFERRIQRETLTAVSRLQVKSPPLYDAYDRMMAEAELRLSLLLPLLALVSIVSLQWNLWALGFALIPLILAYQGAGKEIAARRLLSEAFNDGLVESATMERLNAWLTGSPGDFRAVRD